MIDVSKLTIKQKVLYIVIGIVTISLLLITLLYFFITQNTLDKNIKEALVSNNAMLKAELEYLVKTTESTLKENLFTADIYLGINGKFSLDTGSIQNHDVVNQTTKEKNNIDIPTMRLGGTTVYQDYQYVDKLNEVNNSLVTIFQMIPNGMLRISTNVKSKEGLRAIDTYIPSESKVYQSITNGHTYIGEAVVVGEKCFTIYKPIFENGQVIGALFIGRKLSDLYSVMFTQMDVYKKGEYRNCFIFRTKDKDKGNLIYHPILKDSLPIDPVIDKMIEQKNGFLKGTIHIADKKERAYMAFSYYEPLDMMIVSKSSFQEIRPILIKMATVSLFTLILICGLSLLFVTNRLQKIIIRPIYVIKDLIINIGNKNLGFQVDSHEINMNDELGEMLSAGIQTRDSLKETMLLLSTQAEELKSSGLTLKQTSEKMMQGASVLNDKSHDVSKTTSMITDNAVMIATASEEASVNLSNVNGSLNQVTQGIHTIASSVEESNTGLNQIKIEMKHVVDGFAEMNGALGYVVSSIHDSASAMEEMSASIHEISNNTLKASKISEHAEDLANKTQLIINQMQVAVKEIGNIVGVIDDIADQTNMLALNATIEAASAGDAGKGFAVVANEVKELAKQTAEATQKIDNEIGQVQQVTKIAIESIKSIITVIIDMHQINTTIAGAIEEQSITTNEITKSSSKAVEEIRLTEDKASVIKKAVDSVFVNISETEKASNEIAGNSSSVALSAHTISNNSQEVTIGVQEIVRNINHVSSSLDGIKYNMEQITDISNDNSKASQAVKDSAENFLIMADKMVKIVSQFKL